MSCECRFVPFWIMVVLACSEPPTTAPNAAHADHIPVDPVRCTIEGRGLFASGDSSGGSVFGNDLAGGGDWTLWTASGEAVDLTPEWTLCRVNGANVADFAGNTIWAGRPATFRVTVHDERAEHRPLTATRYYMPAGWQDDRIMPTDAATIPAFLPVIIGNAGNQQARLTFEPVGEPAIRCDYRGGARSAMPTDPSDITLGLRYEFRRCERFDPVTGLWNVDPAQVPGVRLQATSVTLHVQNGSLGYPTMETAQTTVSVAVTDVDFLRVLVWDLETGERMFIGEGLIVAGDFTVTMRQ